MKKWSQPKNPQMTLAPTSLYSRSAIENRLSNLWIAFYEGEEANLKHTIRFHASKTVFFFIYTMHTCYFCAQVYFAKFKPYIL